jgi:solute:Na+ symporter, SSS family
VASNVLKWYWWRFNGYGYFWGMLSGLVPALIFPLIFKTTLELYYFPVLLLLSLIGCFLGSYLSEPTDDKTLISFYKTVRPWGFWRPVLQKVNKMDPSFQPNRQFGRDAINILVGTVWQTALVIMPFYLVLMQKWPLIWTLVLIAASSWFLKKNWLDKLPEN